MLHGIPFFKAIDALSALDLDRWLDLNWTSGSLLYRRSNILWPVLHSLHYFAGKRQFIRNSRPSSVTVTKNGAMNRMRLRNSH
jgi:hypothetical protein